MKIKVNNKGYSMTELIVAIAIIAILTGVLGISVIIYVEKAEKAKALTDAKAIYSAAQYAIANVSVDESTAFGYAVKFEETINGEKVRLGRFSNQSLYKYLMESQGSGSLSSALSKKADYYIAAQLANSICGADGTIEGDQLKNKSPIGDNSSTKYISDHPETYGKVVFAMAYNEFGEIVYFQCVYNGYFMTMDGKELKAEKVSESTKFNNWPQTRAPGTDGW